MVSGKIKVGVIGLKGLPAFGGAASVGENLIRELKNNFRFTVYAVSSHTNVAGEQDGYYQIVFRSFFIKKMNVFFYYLKAALHALFFSNYDLIHLHHTDGAFILPLLRLKYKVICTSHAQPQIAEKWPRYVKVFFTINEKVALNLSNILTAVSKNLTHIYTQKTRKKVYYIPNGISLQQEVFDEKIPDDKYILFSAGRIIPLKGLHILLEAYRIKDPGIKLKIIGNLGQIPSYEEKIRAEAKKIFNIEFIPLIRGKEKLLNFVKQAELFIFPSYSENMSMMLLETAFTGTPIICSDIPANKAIFSNDEVLFFKTNNAQDLADKIHFALKNKNIMKSKAEKALKKIETDYNWETLSDKYKKLYESLYKI